MTLQLTRRLKDYKSSCVQPRSVCDVLADDHAMLQVFHKVFAKIESKLGAGIYHLRCELAVTKNGPRKKR